VHRGDQVAGWLVADADDGLPPVVPDDGDRPAGERVGRADGVVKQNWPGGDNSSEPVVTANLQVQP
jgi:hypothetical protein